MLVHLFRRQNYSFHCCQVLFEVKSTLKVWVVHSRGFLLSPDPNLMLDRAESCLGEVSSHPWEGDI